MSTPTCDVTGLLKTGGTAIKLPERLLTINKINIIL